MSAPSIGAPSVTGSPLAGPRRAARLVWLEFRFSYAWLLMPVVIAVAIWFFNAWMWQPDRQWAVVSSNIAQTMLLIGPAGAMWTAMLAGRERGSGLRDLTASLPVRALSRHLLVMGVPVAGTVLAYGIGAAVLIVRYRLDRVWGAPDWPMIGFGAVVVLACALIGAVIGYGLAGRFVPVIAGGTVFLYFVMSWSVAQNGTTLRGWALLTYPRDHLTLSTPLDVLPEGWDAATVPLTAGYLIAAGAVCAAVALLVAVHRRWAMVVPFGLAALAMLAVAVPMTRITAAERATADAAWFGEWAPVQNPPQVCAGEVVTTCLHPMDERDLAGAAGTVDTLLAPLTGLPGVPSRIETRKDVPTTDEVLRLKMAGQRIDASAIAMETVLPLVSDAGFPLTSAQQAIATALLRPVVPLNEVWFVLPDETGENVEEDIARWQAEIAAHAERFLALSESDRRAWLETNWNALRSGELTLEDLP